MRLMKKSMTGPQKLTIIIYIIGFIVYAIFASLDYERPTVTGAIIFTIPFAAFFYLAKEFEFKDKATFPLIVRCIFSLIGVLFFYLLFSSIFG